jgi:hypothetical protein
VVDAVVGVVLEEVGPLQKNVTQALIRDHPMFPLQLLQLLHRDRDREKWR